LHNDIDKVRPPNAEGAYHGQHAHALGAGCDRLCYSTGTALVSLDTGQDGGHIFAVLDFLLHPRVVTVTV